LSYGAGITLGCVLGSAVTIHNGLFILQVPIAVAFGLFWLRGIRLPHRSQVIAFGAALVTTTLLVCLPSEPWQRGFFEFYTLSWFHFYVAACVAAFSVLLVLIERNSRNIVIVLAAAAAAVLPVVGTLAFAGEFISGDLDSIRKIAEVRSPYVVPNASRSTTWLLWLTGPMLLLNLWWIYRRKDPVIQFVAIVGVMGLALMQSQYRFSVFGDVSMLLTPILAVHFLCESRPELRRIAVPACIALFAVAFYPTLVNWQMIFAPGGTVAYTNVRSVFPVLKQHCAERPGTVLADIDTGHWVTYHSKCSVIANVFLLTAQHAAKAAENSRMLARTPAELLTATPKVRYVLARHSFSIKRDEKGAETPNLEEMRLGMQPTERELLAPEPNLPPQFKLLYELRTSEGQIYARLYEIERTT
jgi:hypothetical protein